MQYEMKKKWLPKSTSQSAAQKKPRFFKAPNGPTAGCSRTATHSAKMDAGLRLLQWCSPCTSAQGFSRVFAYSYSSSFLFNIPNPVKRDGFFGKCRMLTLAISIQLFSSAITWDEPWGFVRGPLFRKTKKQRGLAKAVCTGCKLVKNTKNTKKDEIFWQTLPLAQQWATLYGFQIHGPCGNHGATLPEIHERSPHAPSKSFFQDQNRQNPDLPSGLKPNAQHVFEAFRCTLGHTWSHGCGQTPFPHWNHQIIINLNPSNLEAEAFPKENAKLGVHFGKLSHELYLNTSPREGLRANYSPWATRMMLNLRGFPLQIHPFSARSRNHFSSLQFWKQACQKSCIVLVNPHDSCATYQRTGYTFFPGLSHHFWQSPNNKSKSIKKDQRC